MSASLVYIWNMVVTGFLLYWLRNKLSASCFNPVNICSGICFRVQKYILLSVLKVLCFIKLFLFPCFLRIYLKKHSLYKYCFYWCIIWQWEVDYFLLLLSSFSNRGRINKIVLLKKMCFTLSTVFIFLSLTFFVFSFNSNFK